MESLPWIRFEIDLRPAPVELWMMLGECQSKCEHIAGVPLRPDTAKKLHEVYLAKGSLATTAIEGNTLSEEQVRQHIQGTLRLPPSKQYLEQEVDNIIAEANRIGEQIASGAAPELTPDRIRELNAQVLRGLDVDEDTVPGQVRKHEVGVGRYRGAPARDCEHLLDRLCAWLNSDVFSAPPGREIVFAIIKAVVAHLYLAWIHPFGDGNGRTARLVEFQILIASGVPAPAAHLLSNHYNLTRSRYYAELDKASRSGGQLLSFLGYAVEGFRDGLREQLDGIRYQQWDVTWRNYVHEKFRDKSGDANRRRRHLVLDLSRRQEPVPVDELPEVSPRMAKAYATKTKKTLTRDVNELERMQLVERTPQGVRACMETILAFLPLKAGAPADQGP